MNKMEKSNIPQKYKNFAKHCVGRSIIQLPESFVRSNIVTAYFKRDSLANNYFDVLIDDGVVSAKDFLNRITERSTELKKAKMFTTVNLKQERKLSDTAMLFRVQEVDDDYRDELYFILGRSIAVVKLDSFHNEFVLAEEQLIKFMSGFSEKNSRKTSGFCIGNLSVEGNFVDEKGGFYWRDKFGNTFDINIDTFGAQDETPLLDRMNGPHSLLSLFHIGHTVLRSGERTVAGMRAQEWLGWTKLGENGTEKTFKFVLETTRLNGSRKTPSMKITFDSAKKLEDGTETKTNMTDDEAMAIWDAVINSVQPME